MSYDKYKSSGIELIGDVPTHWRNYRVDWISAFVRGNTGFKKDELLNNGEYVALQYGKTYKVDEVNNSFNFFVNSEFYKYNQIVKRGDTIFISTSETIEDLGHTCFYNREELGLLGGEQILLKPNSKLINGKYLYYYSKFFTSELKKYATGLKVFRFNTDDLKRVFIAIPLLDEQTAITKYLDVKTQAIDKKINLLSKKANFYKELRKSIINDSVCTGLDKKVKLQESGIEWIGKIPQHWELKRLKDVFKFSKGKNASNYNQDFLNDTKNQGEYPVYSGQTENDGLMALINIYEYNIRRKVILVSTVGAKAMEVKILSGKFTLSQNCALIENLKVKENCDFFYYFLTQLFREERKIIPTIMQPSLRIEDLVKYFLLVPPREEQIAIANYLDEKTQKIDAIVTNIGKQIEILKELRKTLINDVVTGKIKVTL